MHSGSDHLNIIMNEWLSFRNMVEKAWG